MIHFIEGPEVKLTVNDGIFLDVDFATGEHFDMLEPHCLFPISGRTKYIVLLDNKANRSPLCATSSSFFPNQNRQWKTACVNIT